MFEFESEDYATMHSTEKHSLEWWSKRNAFQKGAELGYATAKKNMSTEDLLKELLDRKVIRSWYYNGSYHAIGK